MNFSDAFLRVEQEQDYIVDLLRKLIAVNTSVPPGENYAELVDIIEPELNHLGFETKRIVVPEEKYQQIPEPLSGDRINLLGVLKNNKPRSTFYGHMDVVPIDDSWTEDPFGGTIKDGKLYGRGATDMKGSIACFLGAAKVIHDMGLDPNYQMECCFCTDEEVGVYPGVRYLAEEGYLSDHLVWGELGPIEPAVLTAFAGDVRIEITAVGKSCHSGVNWRGVNAIEEFIPILQALMDLKREVEKRESRIPGFPIEGAPSDKMTPMFNLNIIHGGVKENIVAGECRLTINRRYLPDEKYEDVVSEIEGAVRRSLEKTKLLDLKIDFHKIYSPVEIDPETDVSKKMRAAASAVWGYKDYLYGGVSGSTDMGFVFEALHPVNPQVACCGISGLKNPRAHATDEFVHVEDLIAVTKKLIHYYAF